MDTKEYGLSTLQVHNWRNPTKAILGRREGNASQSSMSSCISNIYTNSQINYKYKKFQPATPSEVDHGQFLLIWIWKSLDCIFQLSNSNNPFLEKQYQHIPPAWLLVVLCLNHVPGLSA